MTAGRWLKVAAEHGYTIAKATCAALADKWDIEISEIQRMEWVVEGALHGSKTSMNQLKELDSDTHRGKQQEYKEKFWLRCYNVSRETYAVLAGEGFQESRLVLSSENTVCGDFGTTLFHAAAMAGSLSVLRQVREVNNVDVNVVNQRNETALLLACRSGHVDIVKYLVSQGANGRVSSICGENGLHWLQEFDESAMFEIAWELLQAGAEIQKESSKEVDLIDEEAQKYFLRRATGTPLHCAATSGNRTAVQTLLDLGANPTFESARFTPVCWAIITRQLNILELLLAYVEDFDANRLYPNVRGEVVVPLVIRAIQGQSRLLYHFHQQSYKDELLANIIEILLRYGAKTFDIPRDAILETLSNHEPLALSHILSSSGCRRLDDHKYTGRDSELMRAIMQGDKECFEVLIKHGADPLTEIPFGRYSVMSTIHGAVKSWHTDTYILDRLIELGVDVNHNKDPTMADTPIFYALHQGLFDMADRLIRSGARLDVEAVEEPQRNVLGALLNA